MLLLIGPSLAREARAQADYRNLDAGFPVRIEDAIVTERYALDLDLANIRFDALSGGRRRLQFEPEITYGIFPRTEMWVRTTTYYRERQITPRKGVAGVGVGGMYQFNVETLDFPALAIASEIYLPAGRNRLPPSYSLKTALTKSFTQGRIHLNASIASYATRVPASACVPDINGSGCGVEGGIMPLPPLDGPCAMAPPTENEFYPMPAALQSVQVSSNATAGPESLSIVTHGHWLAGIGADKTLPLSSIVFVGDLFAEKFEGIGRTTDWTTEFGVRKQIAPNVVVLGSVGRHFKGLNDSLFFVIGATFGRALQFVAGAE